MNIEKGLMYSKDHEWVRVEGNRVFIGITEYAQNALGDIVFVELPEIGIELKAGDTLGVVESVKSASDIYTPVSGKVVEVNEDLTKNPENINKYPYKSWIAAIESDDFSSDLDNLMDAAEYEEYCSKEE